MFHAPIYGSQINPPAKLFKRFTPTETVKLDGAEITFENNYYRCFHKIQWADATEKTEGEVQPIGGALISTGAMTIKFHGTYKPKDGDPREPRVGDLIMINKETWIIEDGIQRIRIKSLVNFATVYLPLRRLL